MPCAPATGVSPLREAFCFGVCQGLNSAAHGLMPCALATGVSPLREAFCFGVCQGLNSAARGWCRRYGAWREFVFGAKWI
jgi:hypothetical protein